MNGIGYHVARRAARASILAAGLLAHVPADREWEPEAVYLFPSTGDLSSAMDNWLGDRFDEEGSLDVVTVALDGLPTIPGAEYEVVVPEDIPASRVIGIVDMDAFLSEPSLCHG
jgi:hypothetical protein